MGYKRRMQRAKQKQGRFRGYGLVKMSEVLLDFAEPLTRSVPEEDVPAFRAALNIAALLWNEAVRPSPGGTRELYARLRHVADDVPADLEVVFDAIIARGRALYPGLDRTILQVKVEVDDDGCFHVNVVSTD